MKRIIIASAAALVLLPAAIAAAQAPRKLSNPGSFTISTSMGTKPAADALAAAMGGPTNRRKVDYLLDHANRPLAPLCSTGSTGAVFPLASHATGELGFCWSMGDPGTEAWVPQGITTTADALGARAYDGRQAVVVTWYNDTEKSTRISIAPASGYAAGETYRHVLLVTPQTATTFARVNCHAGGALWYGHLLHVACTDHIKVFDWDDVYSADTSAFCADRVGRTFDPAIGADRFCASGYAYIMMQVGQITNPSGNVRFSSISLDRASSPDRLVVVEYSTSTGATLERFDLDATTRLPSGTSAVDAYELPFTLVQGATARNARFWFHSSGRDPVRRDPGRQLRQAAVLGFVDRTVRDLHQRVRRRGDQLLGLGRRRGRSARPAVHADRARRLPRGDRRPPGRLQLTRGAAKT